MNQTTPQPSSYTKNFDGWNERKKELSKTPQSKLFHEREIWWCAIGVNVGDEIDGKHHNFERPVLVLKKLSHKTFIGISLTSTVRTRTYFYDLPTNQNNQGQLLFNQAKTFDSKRLLRRIKIIGSQKHEDIVKKYKNIF